MKKVRFPVSIGMAVCTLGLALTLTLVIVAVFMRGERYGSTDGRVNAAPTVLTYTSYLPVVAPGDSSSSAYGVEMVAATDGSGMNLMREARNSWVHLAGISWFDIEPTEGARNWSKMAFHEQNFLNAQASNMKVVILVRGTPLWAQLIPPWECGPITPTKLTAFADFMYELVQRYSVPPYNVKYWELGNEPDVDKALLADTKSLFGCWGNADDPYYGGGRYAEMLKVVYKRIKPDFPQVQLLVGGLLLDCDPRLTPSINRGCPDASAQRPPRFLEGILRSPKGGDPYWPFFDGVSFHSYDYTSAVVAGTYSNNRWQAASNTNGSAMLAKTAFLQSVLAQYGASSKYIINTEVAVRCEVLPECYGVQTNTRRIVYEKTKAYLIAQVFPQMVISGLHIVMWWRNIDDDYLNTGMLNNDLTPRFAYTAFVVSRAHIGDATYERALTEADYGNVANVRGYSFKRDKQRIWIVWAKDNLTKTLTLPITPTAAFNHLGASLVVSPNKQLRIYPPDNQFAYVVWDQ